MSDIDNALNSSAPVWAPAELDVDWQEQFPNLSFSGNPDRINDMSQQMTGAFEVEHSLDDGFPDPVTMTSGADASGKATIPLLGRQGITANTTSVRSSTSDTGTGANGIFWVDLPPDVQYGDYLVCSVALNSSTASIINYADDTEAFEQWKLLGTITDGPTLSLWVFGKRTWGASEAGFTCDFSETGLSYTAIICGLYARGFNPNIWIDLVPQSVKVLAETVSSTSHSGPEIELRRRGYGVSVWACATASGPITPTGMGVGGGELAEITTPLDVSVAIFALSEPGDYTPTATTNVATSTLAMITIALEIADRPTMDARQFFSPFNKQSPIYGWDRDTAETELRFLVITPNGPKSTVLHKGQMADIAIKGPDVQMSAISKTRIDLDKSLNLPMVYADRENCSIDWLVTWVMARGGQWVGPSPSPNTRFWGPLYGSTHGHFDSPYSYSGGLRWDATTGSGGAAWRPVTSVEGPFLTAMYGEQTATQTLEVIMNIKLLHLANPAELPTYYPLFDQFLFYDQFSDQSSQGRITFWLRGDPVTAAPSYLDSSNDFIFKYNLHCRAYGDAFLGWVIITVRSSDRYISVWMGSEAHGSGTVQFNSVGALPTDGQWHFVGISWDFLAGTAKVKLDANESTTNNYWATSGYNGTDQLPFSDEDLRNNSGYITNDVRSHVPISDILIESGAPAFSNPWSRHYPPDRSVNSSYEGSNATMRPTFQKLLAVVESAPRQGWELLAELAQASLSSYRVNEEDNLEFLPMSYFGEAAQMASTVVVDTEVNSAELDVFIDPSKTRNVVTAKFPEFRIAFALGDILASSTAVEIPRGTTTMVFTLDAPAVAFWKQEYPFGAEWTLTNLTSSQISTPSLPWVHYMTVNTLQDGTGTVLPATSVTGKIIIGDASTITIQFLNKTSKSAWLANNGTEVPFLRILGIPVTILDGYVTSRHDDSSRVRRERSLDVELPWVQDRETASEVASLLVTALARPRAEVTVTVMGDPRGKPGQVVTLKDGQGTQADGTWRIMSVKHNVDGPQYTQNLKLVRVLPTAVWDGTDGWDVSGWGE